MTDSAMRCRLAPWLVCLVGAAAVLVAVGGSLPAFAAGQRAAASPLRVVTSLQPQAAAFGDRVTAQVEVDYDPKVVDASSISVRPNFIPYVAGSAPTVSRGSGVVRYSFSLLCVTNGCLPTKGPRVVRVQPVTATATAGGRTVTASGAWPPLRVLSRLSPSDLTGSTKFRSPATPPPATYRISPGVLSGLLIAAAVLCVLAALALVALAIARLIPRSAPSARSPLELAILYLRDSTGRSAKDRRRALELLAEAVDAGGEPTLAAVAADSAWSKSPPSPGGAADLADRAAGLSRGSEP